MQQLGLLKGCLQSKTTANPSPQKVFRQIPFGLRNASLGEES
jgi:hypothetical protein